MTRQSKILSIFGVRVNAGLVMYRLRVLLVVCGGLGLACGGGGGSSGPGDSAAPKSWSDPVEVSQLMTISGSPDVAMAADGSGIVAFVEGRLGLREQVGVVTYLPASGWSVPQNVSGTDVTALAIEPSVAINADGEAMAAWHRFDPAGDDVSWAVFRPAGGSWGTPTALRTTSDLGDAMTATEASGRFIVAFEESIVGLPGSLIADVAVSAITFPTLATSTSVVDAQTAVVRSDVAVAVDGFDTTYTAWTQDVGSGISLFAAFGTAPMLTQELIDVLSPPTGSPSIAANSIGDAFVVWKQAVVAGMPERIFVRRRPRGPGLGAWETPVRLDANTGSAMRDPLIVADATGNALVMWEELRATPADGQDIWAARLEVGTGWRAAERIGLSSGLSALAGTSNGDAVALWRAFDDGNAIEARRFTLNGSWEAPQRIANDSPSFDVFSAAMAPDGSAIVAWSASAVPGGGGATRIMASVFR